MARFEALLKKAVTDDKPLRVAVVGAGASGVEVACALQYRSAGLGVTTSLNLVLMLCSPVGNHVPVAAWLHHTHAVLALPLHCCRLQKERQAVGITSGLTVSLVSRGPILQGLTPYARRAFLPLLKVSQESLLTSLLCGVGKTHSLMVPNVVLTMAFAALRRSVASLCMKRRAGCRRCSLQPWCWATARQCPLTSAGGPHRCCCFS